ncbi:MAG: hypothetical protein ACE5F1_08560, partial [Planctomycetota bacterium]
METLCAMCLLLAGCAGSAEAPTLELPVLPVRVQAADRRPLGIVIELAKLGSRRRRAIETWFFEALDQSPFLDLELDPGEAQSPLLVLRGEVPGSDQATGTLTTSFVENGKAPVPLAGVLLGTNTALTDAIDRLALATRLALGESRESVLAQRQAVEAIVSPSERVAAACALARLQVRRRNRMNA